MNILVLCTGNSARSILLEAILNETSNGQITAYSAGSQPTGRVHPQSLKLLSDIGYSTAQATSQSWDEYAKPDAPQMDMVITVCGSAAEETCPMWPGSPLTVHWGVEDPAAAPEAEQPEAFQTTFDILSRRAAHLIQHLPNTTESATLKSVANAAAVLS